MTTTTTTTTIKAKVKTTKFGYCPKVTVYENGKHLWTDEKRSITFLTYEGALSAAEEWAKELANN
jgi:hypothetical protein